MSSSTVEKPIDLSFVVANSSFVSACRAIFDSGKLHKLYTRKGKGKPGDYVLMPFAFVLGTSSAPAATASAISGSPSDEDADIAGFNRQDGVERAYVRLFNDDFNDFAIARQTENGRFEFLSAEDFQTRRSRAASRGRNRRRSKSRDRAAAADHKVAPASAPAPARKVAAADPVRKVAAAAAPVDTESAEFKKALQEALMKTLQAMNLQRD
jgi:hypothetical protein